MQGRIIEVLQKSFIAFEIYDPLGNFCCLRIRFAIIPDQLGDGFNLIGENSFIHWKAQAVFGRVELGAKPTLL